MGVAAITRVYDLDFLVREEPSDGEGKKTHTGE